MTYSIVAFDHDTGEIGIAMQSHWFNVGQRCAWVRSGLGVVATQALTDVSYGRLGLALMADGQPVTDTLETLLSNDPAASRRQVAMVDATGGVAVHTGSDCLDYSGHRTGDGWSVQGNLLTSPECVDAIAEAFDSSSGTLARRLLGALEAAEMAGGDLRGSQSAVIRILAGPPALASVDPAARDDTGLDLWVADHPAPIVELRRLLDLDEAYLELRLGGIAAERGDASNALEHLGRLDHMVHDAELDFWLGLHLDKAGHRAEALTVLHGVIDHDPRFGEVLRRLAQKVPLYASIAESLLPDS